jgi:hypothetical protein
MRSETEMHPWFPIEGGYPVVTPEPDQTAIQARVGRVYLIDIWGSISVDKRAAVTWRWSEYQSWRAVWFSLLVVSRKLPCNAAVPAPALHSTNLGSILAGGQLGNGSPFRPLDMGLSVCSPPQRHRVS